MAIFLSQLLSGLLEVPSRMDCRIAGLALDSRQVQPGFVFFALPGFHEDGRCYIQDALAKGAAAVIVDASAGSLLQSTEKIFCLPNLKYLISRIAGRFYDHPANALQIIGITGTNGKTSCSHFIASVLQQLNKPCAIIGTLGSGLFGSLRPTGLTTPDAIFLHQVFTEYRLQGVTHVSMEVSSHSLDQGRVQDIPFQIGLFTNLTRDHLDYHKTMEAYAQAKQKLFLFPLRYAVLNIDDPFGRTLLSVSRNTNLTYSIDSKADVYVTEASFSLSGIRAKIATPWGEGVLISPLLGSFNLSNLLGVLTTLCLLDVPLDQALEELAQVGSVPGRMQTLGGGVSPLIIVDYAHTPDSLEKTLMALRAHCEGQLICVFGCGGDRDAGKRPLMAAIAEHYSDHVVVTDDNPRTEPSDKIVCDIKSGFKQPEKIICQQDRSKAIQYAIQYAKTGDCVLIAGKGAETHQLIGNTKIPFSDIDQVRSCLNSLQ